MRATLHNFAKNLDVTDLRWMPDDGFSIGRLRIELLSGLTVALALVPEAQRNRACICQRCIQSFVADPPGFAARFSRR